MYSLVEFTEELDLAEFYSKCADRGFVNNCNQKMLVDCFKKERAWQVWILYYNSIPAGSVAAHSLTELGPNAYRICARTCVLTDLLPKQNLRSLKECRNHQHITGQFFIPKCIEWAGEKNDLYITSHPSEVGTQKLVHNIYCPELVKTGALEKTCVMHYRGHEQTFWKLNVPVYLSQLNSLPRW